MVVKSWFISRSTEGRCKTHEIEKKSEKIQERRKPHICGLIASKGKRKLLQGNKIIITESWTNERTTITPFSKKIL
jgi:hypothetical protein